MSDYTPTRSNLLLLRVEERLAKEGSNLLKSKRDALVKDFFKYIADCMQLRERLEACINSAFDSLVLAKAVLGEDVLNSFVFAAGRDTFVDMRIDNVWGINVPRIEEKDFRRRLDERGVSPIGESPMAMEVARRFEDIITSVIILASRETKLKMLGEEIKTTTRKINAINELIIPVTENKIKFINMVLEEREREDVYRLKRFKRKKKHEEFHGYRAP